AFTLNGSILSGDDATGLTKGQVLVGSTNAGITSVYVGTDDIAGSDVTIDLLGSFAVADFQVVNDFLGASLRYTQAGILMGTQGSDFLTGQVTNDNIQGLGGDDYLYGNDGNDSLYGGDGSDNLRGEAGNDMLDGGASWDYLYGGDGDDVLAGGDQAD